MIPPRAPAFAADDQLRAIELCDVAGRSQVVSWDRASGRRRVLTEARHGVDAFDLEPDGGHVWWFDTDPDGVGLWRRQPFEGGPAAPALTGVPPGRPYGIAFDHTGRLAVVCVGDAAESRHYLGTPGGPAHLLAAAPGYVPLVDLSADGTLLALAGRPDGPTAVTVVRLTDGRTEILAGDRHRRVWALEFRPGPGDDTALLVVVETGGCYTVGTWRPGHDLRLHERLSFDTEITAHWYVDGRRVLVQQDRTGRSRLLLSDLVGGAPSVLPTPPGTILDLACAPEGAVHYVWSREAVPPSRLVVDPATDRHPAPAPPAASGRGEVWTPQPYGRIHSFLATPPGTGPWPAIFLLHGGPFLHDRDSYDPRVELLTGAGYAVVRTNYRGSTGYGPRWRHDFGHRVGLAQLEDLAAVRRHLVDLGVTEPGRVGLCGYSWGGYLVLLAMGVEPDDWAVGLAVSPVADYATAHRTTLPALREADEELFGGTPAEVPDRYRAANPMTYLDRVRGPLFVAAATDDERCPAEAVRRYVAALRDRSVPHEVLWSTGGHHGNAAAQTTVFTALLRYAGTVLPPGVRAPAPLSQDHRDRRGPTPDPPEGGECNEATHCPARPDQHGRAGPRRRHRQDAPRS
ncbi:prolyl oligopeptidase family serine peptidase [Micromonospora sp. NBC_01655]|uniref:S9 family peptidase n=1 Tax=Micromonospora sp. NBC_01655 TaxID=2975983 RepID=UPI00224ED077|nr:prolyl oligopeptidase family serine peptidase [Micromonospora sp. NBC_01655]MCX4471708.1 prolyl oligopeptidase family serine peptidase [Micromonospora sp. NBC_01655]